MTRGPSRRGFIAATTTAAALLHGAGPVQDVPQARDDVRIVRSLAAAEPAGHAQAHGRRGGPRRHPDEGVRVAGAVTRATSTVSHAAQVRVRLRVSISPLRRGACVLRPPRGGHAVHQAARSCAELVG